MTQNQHSTAPATPGAQPTFDRANELDKFTRAKTTIQQIGDWLTGEEVMSLLSISRRTLQNYRDRGLIGFSAIGKKFYYRAAEIRDHLERHYQPPFAR